MRGLVDSSDNPYSGSYLQGCESDSSDTTESSCNADLHEAMGHAEDVSKCKENRDAVRDAGQGAIGRGMRDTEMLVAIAFEALEDKILNEGC